MEVYEAKNHNLADIPGTVGYYITDSLMREFGKMKTPQQIIDRLHEVLDAAPIKELNEKDRFFKILNTKKDYIAAYYFVFDYHAKGHGEGINYD